MRGDNVDKNVFNAYSGGQVIIANDDSTVYVEQNNNSKVSINNFKKFQNNKKQDYIDNWNGKLFLHNDNDERALTLADAFIMPHYEYHVKDRRMNFSDIDTMNEVIEKFIKHNRSANMLITGAPGIGKTSIVSCIANEYKENDDIIILRFRDWERDELNNGLFKAICDTLDCRKRDLENKIIILDGYDEIKDLNNGEYLIGNFINGILDFKNMKAIITSRTDYITDYLFEFSILLLPFQIDEIKKFYNKITGSEFKHDLVLRNLDVLGIPVILYLAIMSGVDITKEATKPELYSRIFAEKGGIFDKFSYDGDGYDYGNQILRDSKNIQKYLGFLQEIAFEMFDEEKLSLPRKEDKIPKLTFEGTEISVLEFPIKHLFDNTLSNIEFVHKSIYEYFVVEYIVKNIKDVLKIDDYKEKLACFFGKTLLHGNITYEIIELLKYKINNSDLKDSYHKVAEAFHLMLKDGMIYHTNMRFKKAIICEMTVFANMLEVLHLWERFIYLFDATIIDYLYFKYKKSLNLSGVNLSGANLIGIDLSEANLIGANLSGANLSGASLIGVDLSEANLIGANLSGVNLSGASLIGVDLIEANLIGANLSGANLSGVDLSRADLKGADLKGADLKGANLKGADLRYNIFYENQVQQLKRKCDLKDSKVVISKNGKNKTVLQKCLFNLLKL